MSEDKIPYMAIGNEELEGQPIVTLEDEGRLVKCTRCGGEHPLSFGTDQKTGEKTTSIGAISCSEKGKTYLVAVGGRLMPRESWSAPTEEGLKMKYVLHKADGRPVDPAGEYFVLKVNSRDDNHALCSRLAVLAYAANTTNEELKKDLQEWIRRLELERPLIGGDHASET